MAGGSNPGVRGDGEMTTQPAQSTLNTVRKSDIIRTDARELPQWMVDYLMAQRHTLIMQLGSLEDLLGLERSITPRRKR